MFDIGGVLSRGYEGFKANVGAFIGAMIIALVISMGLNFGTQIVVGVLGQKSQNMALIIMLVMMIIQQIVSCLLTLGGMNMCLKVARGQPAEVGDLFAIGSFAVPGLVTYVAVGFLCLIGFILLIIPGIIISLGTGLSLWFVIDKQLDPVTAIKASWTATTGSKGQIFLFGIVAFLLLIVGMIPCGLGLLVVYPTVGIAMAHIYIQLSGYAKLEA